MKIQVRRLFSYTFDNIKTHTLEPGIRDVSKEVADLAISFRAASRYVEPVAKKAAPENKVIAAPENKAADAPKSKIKKAKKAK